MDTFDFIVVGGGSSGSTVAGRLSEIAVASVLVIEAGPGEFPDRVDIPHKWPTLFKTEFDWDYQTVPQKHLNDRQITETSGRLIGGSSNFYHMIHIRGAALDYDSWAYGGCPGWSFEECLPYFQKLEGQVDETNPTAGKGGPLPLTPLADKDTSPASRLFVESAQTLGYPYTDDFNGPNMLGVGWHHVNIKDGERYSCRRAYLEPALEKPLVSLQANATVARVLIEGNRCVGVEYVKDGQLKQARAEKEVIICAGAIQSPKVLMLSGIGNPEHLARHGIDVKVDLPGVGENFHNHVLTVGPIIKCKEEFPGPQLNLSECALFWKSDPAHPVPDLQIGFVHSPSDVVTFLDDRSIVTMVPGMNRPLSRGWIRLASDKPEDHPQINTNYYAEPIDLERHLAAVKIARDIYNAKPFADHVVAEVHPGPDTRTDNDLREFLRNNADSYWHYAGSCKMGLDNMAVVDPYLRVHGVEGLRVADASVMPALPSSNPHAGIVMIAERAADFIKQSL